jgi:hypothetical protein
VGAATLPPPWGLSRAWTASVSFCRGTTFLVRWAMHSSGLNSPSRHGIDWCRSAVSPAPWPPDHADHEQPCHKSAHQNVARLRPAQGCGKALPESCQERSFGLELVHVTSCYTACPQRGQKRAPSRNSAPQWRQWVGWQSWVNGRPQLGQKRASGRSSSPQDTQRAG